MVTGTVAGTAMIYSSVGIPLEKYIVWESVGTQGAHNVSERCSN